MVRFEILAYNNDYELIRPKNEFDVEFGYIMVVNPNGEVLKFFESGSIENAKNYFDYISLSKWDKLKFWLNYKRGEL